MRKQYRVIVLLVGVAVLGGMLTVGTLPIASGQPKMPDSAAGWEYVGNSQCKICHNSAKEGSQYDKWKEANHANAFNALKGAAAQEIAKERGMDKPPHEAPECIKCHVTGYDVEKAAAPAKIKMEDGVQCETCHGPASEHLTVARQLKFSPDKITEIDIKATHVHPTEETCRACHNDESPTWDPERYTKEDGTKVGFDFDQAWAKINHAFPEGAMEEKYGGKYPVD